LAIRARQEVEKDRRKLLLENCADVWTGKVKVMMQMPGCRPSSKASILFDDHRELQEERRIAVALEEI
jgi:hypothetical protein